MTSPLPRIVAGIAATTALLLPLSAPAGATTPTAERAVSSAAPSATGAPTSAARIAYTRTQRKARVDKLMTGSLGRFQRVKNRARSGIDTTFNWSDDGCSAPWWTGTAYYSAVFNRACERHDFGYRNLGWGYYTSKNLALSSTPGTKDAIDKVFLADMRALCANRGSGTASCLSVAQGFYGAVRKTGKAHTSFYKSECQPGFLCLFDDKGYQDRRVRLSASENNMKDVSFGDKTSSVKNTSGVAWRLYDDADYRDRSLCVPRNGYASNLNDYNFGDKTSSARRYSTAGCP